MSEPWMTKREIAAHFRVSVSTIERVRPPFIRVGGQNRYRPSEVEAFMRGPIDRPDNVITLRPRSKGAA
jgi:hypothetical protein